MKSATGLIWTLGACALVAACGGDDPTSPSPEPRRTVASVNISPTNPTVATGDTVQLRSTLLDQDGQAFATTPEGVKVTWSSADEAVATVDDAGTVTGRSAGSARITATAAGKSATTTVTVTSVATSLHLASGNQQEGDVGATLAEKLVVRAVDRGGNGMKGVAVQWVVTAGDGTIEPDAATTDDEGYARATWTLGDVEGEQKVRAWSDAIDDSHVNFTATALPPPVEEYSTTQHVPGMRTMAYHEGRFYHVFHDNSSGDADVYLRTSSDGVHWTPKVRVSDGPAGTAQANASIAVWGSGAGTRVAVSYVDRATANPQLHVAASTDGGATFGPSAQVSSHTDSRSLQGSIAVGEDGTLYAAWARQYAGDRWDDTFFSRSSDGGATWSAPVVAFKGDHYSSASHIVAGRAGEVWIVIDDDQSWKMNLVLRRSTDGGATWGETQITSNTKTGEIALLSSLARAPDGTLHVIWAGSPARGNAPFRVFHARSTDGGVTWSSPVAVQDDVPLGTVYNTDYRQPPSLAVGADGTLHAVWADDREGPGNHSDTRNHGIYLSRSTDGGATWSADVRVSDMPEVLFQAYPAIAVGPMGALVTWVDGRLGAYHRVLHALVP